MNLALFTLLPKLFKTGQLLIRCLEDRKLDSEEVSLIADEFRGLFSTVPELKGFMGIFEILVRVASVVLPIFLGDKAKILEMGLKQEEVEQATAVAKLFSQVIDEGISDGQKAAAAISLDDVEDLL